MLLLLGCHCETSAASGFRFVEVLATLSRKYHLPAHACEHVRSGGQAEGEPYKLYFYMSPYMRSKQTTEALAGVFRERNIAGFQEEVQLREQGAPGFLGFGGFFLGLSATPRFRERDIAGARV